MRGKKKYDDFMKKIILSNVLTQKAMNKNSKKIARKIYYKYPSLRSLLLFIKRTFFFKPKFCGMAIKTEAENPWNDKYGHDIFLKSINEIKKSFKFSLDERGVDLHTIEISLWRYWLVSFATKFAIENAQTSEYNFVECGVADGFSAFISLKEISGNSKTEKFSMHLYDAWGAMNANELLKSEKSKVGKYDHLSINIVKYNLTQFKENIVYHPGYIPKSFNAQPESPKSIVYLSIDLNSAIPTQETLKKFFPALVKGGVIIFDDYGFSEYADTKKVVDKFFHNKPGILLKLPTGQAIFFR